jgi:carbon-monoxide dehydrogenase medium subunit
MLTGFEYHRPTSSRQCSALLHELGPGAKVLAGGTDIVVQMRSGGLRPAHLVDLAGIESAAGIVEDFEEVRVGARTTASAVAAHPTVRAGFEAIAEAAAMVGSRQIQNRATLAGNVGNASPAADTVPALLAYDAQAVVAGPAPRRVRIDDLLVGPRRTNLEPGEWIEAIAIPYVPVHGSSYLKLGRTRGVDIALVGAACLISETSASIALASVGPRAVVVRLEGSFADQASLPDGLAALVRAQVSPIDDVRASAVYRRAMVEHLASRAWVVAWQRLQQVNAA